MLVRIAQLRRVGRFTTFDHPTADEVRFRRLTSLFARNGSGKSTIARVLDAAGRSDAAGLLDHSTLDEVDPPQVTLRFENDGTLRFNGSTWSGTTPRVRVFDRDFIEANVFVGKSLSRDTRASLLEIALGAEAVASKKLLDELSANGRRLTSEIKPHAATLRAASEAARLSEADFLALDPVEDEDAERSRLQAMERDAIAAVEIRRRVRPAQLPELPRLPLGGLLDILARGASRIGEKAEAEVRAHLEGRLGGRGQAWVRDGLALDDRQSCPYCGQDTVGVDLVRHYRDYFDKAWDKLASDLDEAGRGLGDLDRWWEQVKRVGRDNLTAFAAWEDLESVQRPDFDSPTRLSELEAVKARLAEVIDAKRARLDRVVDGTSAVGVARAKLRSIEAAVAAYNGVVRSWHEQIEARLHQLEGLSVETARRALQLLDARLQRHGPNVKRALDERSRLEGEKVDNDRRKAAAVASLAERSETRLEAFGARMNELLGQLGADFRITKLGAERQGKVAAARFTLTVDLGDRDIRELPVVNSSSEAKLARVLSDGDRSTLALAVFLAGLDDVEGLDEHILVFDDPMTSLDWRRCRMTAERITALARSARQVLVLSHHPQFLYEVAYDWRRFGGSGDDLAEVELDRVARVVSPWSAEQFVTHEHIKRWRILSQYAETMAVPSSGVDIRGEIRKYLEGHVRMRWPDLPGPKKDTLEAMIARVRSEPSMRASLSITDAQLHELERLCAFSARSHHAEGHVSLPDAEPEEVRGMVRRALAFGR